jgi:DNA-binding winged helix-turn-helix (wHTH) protein
VVGRKRYAFGAFVADEERMELLRDGVRLSLEPRALRLLLYLIANRERVVSREELHRWWGAAVTDAAINSALKTLRRALADDAREPRWVQTRYKLGYRFIGELVRDSGGDGPRP